MTLGQIWRNAFLRDLLFSALSMATRGNGLRLKQKVQRRFSVVPGWSQAHLICTIMSGLMLSYNAHCSILPVCYLMPPKFKVLEDLGGISYGGTSCSAKSSSHSALSHLFLFYWSLNLQSWMLNEEENRHMQITLRTFKPSRCSCDSGESS